MKIIAFGATNHRQSINKILASYTANLVKNADVEVLDLNDFDVPLFSLEKEQEIGKAEGAKAFYSKLEAADAFVISFAEHNGSYTAAYKNLFDWTSRINQQMFGNKPTVYLATSPGPGGAQSVLTQAVNSASFFQADVKASLSIPLFGEVFDAQSGQPKEDELVQKLQKVADALLV